MCNEINKAHIKILIAICAIHHFPLPPPKKKSVGCVCRTGRLLLSDGAQSGARQQVAGRRIARHVCTNAGHAATAGAAGGAGGTGTGGGGGTGGGTAGGGGTGAGVAASSQHSLDYDKDDDDDDDAVFPLVDVHADCLDVTAQYKFPPGSTLHTYM